MKIRNGFVSNSSSSSFCIYGASMDFDDVVKKVKESKLIPEDELERLEEDDEWYELGEILEEKFELSTYQSDDNFWIGKSWSSIGDDETGRQFKDSIKTKLEGIFGSDIECRTHEEEIYN